MKIIAVDEAGDPNVPPKGSDYLVFGCVFCDIKEANKIREKMREVLKTIEKRGVWPEQLNEIKFSVSKNKLKMMGVKQQIIDKYYMQREETRKYILTEISELSKSIRYAVSSINKKRSNPLSKEPQALYASSLMRPIRDKFLVTFNNSEGKFGQKLLPDKEFLIIPDKGFSQKAKLDIDSIAKGRRKGNLKPVAEIKIEDAKDSRNEPLIWISDMIAGSYYKEIGDNDVSYSSIIKDMEFDKSIL